MTGKVPMIIGHRGAAGSAPENTLASFRMAMEQGCGGIELDVHLSSDGHIMVCHDATIDRTTNGRGWICRMTADEIRRTDAGNWFSEAFEGEKIPLLEEVFDLVPPDILINVEVKHAYDGLMESVLLEFMRQRGRFDNIVVSSFDHKCLYRMKKAEPQVRIGLLYAANLVSHADYAANLEVEVYSLHPQYMLLGREDVAEAAEKEIRVFPYTVNAEEDMHRLADYGVDGIITDLPSRLAAILNEK